MIIGIDFDNTIILYDCVAYAVSLKMELISPSVEKDKVAVRDFIRSSAAGDEGWQRVQGQIYGKEIKGAEIADGFQDFVREMRKRGHTLKVVSHKTELGHFDADRVNLRDAALGWMRENSFFTDMADGGLGFREEDIFFRGTREGKIDKIEELRCDIFIDDLPEVFLESAFPPSVRKVLYVPKGKPSDGMDCFRSWSEILKKGLNDI